MELICQCSFYVNVLELYLYPFVFLKNTFIDILIVQIGIYILINRTIMILQYTYTVEPLMRPPPLERPLDNVNLCINVLIFTPDERPPLLKGHFSDAKGVASQEGFHCTLPHIH